MMISRTLAGVILGKPAFRCINGSTHARTAVDHGRSPFIPVDISAPPSLITMRRVPVDVARELVSSALD